MPCSSRWRIRPNAAIATTSRRETAALASDETGSATSVRSRSRSSCARRADRSDRSDRSLRAHARLRQPTTASTALPAAGVPVVCCCLSQSRFWTNAAARRSRPSESARGRRRAPPPPPECAPPRASPARVARAPGVCPSDRSLVLSHL